MGCCKSRCGTSKVELNDDQKTVLKALSSMKDPSGCKEIAEACGEDSKAVSCKMQSLKKKGLVESPIRCKYVITDSGKAAL